MKRFIMTGSANRLEAEVLKQMDYTNLEEIEEKELVSGFKVRFIHSENMTFSFWNIEKGAQLPEHSHPHEQVTHIIEGRFELTVDGKSKKLGPGSLYRPMPFIPEKPWPKAASPMCFIRSEKTTDSSVKT